MECAIVGVLEWNEGDDRVLTPQVCEAGFFGLAQSFFISTLLETSKVSNKNNFPKSKTKEGSG